MKKYLETNNKKILLLTTMLFLIIFILLNLYKNSYAILNGLDGVWLHILINYQLNEGITSSLSLDPIRGAGNFSTVVNSSLIFAYSVQRIFSNEINVYLSSVIFSIELIVASILCGKVFKFNTRVSLISGLLSCCFILPVFWPHKFYPIFGILPHLSEAFLLCNSALFLITKINNINSNYKNLRFALLSISFLIILVASNPIFCTIFIPYLFFATGYIYFNNSNKKLVTIYILILILIFTMSGALFFHLGFLTYSVPYFFADELYKNQMSVYNISILFHNDLGKYVFLSTISYSIIGFFNKNCIYKNLQKFNLIITIFILGIGYILVSSEKYSGPSMLYFEVPFYLFYILCLTNLLNDIFTFVQYRIKTIILNIIFLILVIVLSYLGFVDNSKNHSNFNYPPTNNTIIEYVKKDISINANNSFFKGRLATFTGVNSNYNISWGDLHGYDNSIAEITNNDFRFIGPWHERIPTFQEYSQTITPPAYFLLSRTLSRPQDRQIRNIIIFSNPNIEILSLYGVKYIITDKKISGLSFIKSISISNNEFYLYSITNPNTGNYSPTNYYLLGDYHSFLKKSINSTIDFRKEVYLEERPKFNFIPAINSSFSINSDGVINVTATNNKGHSIIVLPFEYSNCIKVKNNSENHFELKSVNFNQLAVIFNNKLDLKIEFKTGLFDNANCRIKDSIKFSKMDPKKLSEDFPVSKKFPENIYRDLNNINNKF